MPVVRHIDLFDGMTLAIFEITETHEQLRQNLVATNDEWQDFDQISHPQKQKEWLASRRVLQYVVEHKNLIYKGLQKDEYGKPHLIKHSQKISLTHTKRFVAAVFSENLEVGIDMEQVHEKILRIEGKFTRANSPLLTGEGSGERLKQEVKKQFLASDSSFSTPIPSPFPCQGKGSIAHKENPYEVRIRERLLTQIWCAKEALYKLWGKKNLSFKQQIEVNLEELSGEIFVNNDWQKHRLYAFQIDDYEGMIAY